MSVSVSNEYDSEHDPLCDKWYEYTRPLQFDPDECGICDLTRMVREDMLRRCEEAAYTDLLSLEDDIYEAFGKGSDAARIVAGYRSAMPSFQHFHKKKP